MPMPRRRETRIVSESAFDCCEDGRLIDVKLPISEMQHTYSLRCHGCIAIESVGPGTRAPTSPGRIVLGTIDLYE